MQWKPVLSLIPGNLDERIPYEQKHHSKQMTIQPKKEKNPKQNKCWSNVYTSVVAKQRQHIFTANMKKSGDLCFVFHLKFFHFEMMMEIFILACDLKISIVLYINIIQCNSGVCLKSCSKKSGRSLSYILNITEIRGLCQSIGSYFIPDFHFFLLKMNNPKFTTTDAHFSQIFSSLRKNKRWTHQWNLHYNIWHVQFHSVWMLRSRLV